MISSYDTVTVIPVGNYLVQLFWTESCGVTCKIYKPRKSFDNSCESTILNIGYKLTLKDINDPKFGNKVIFYAIKALVIVHLKGLDFEDKRINLLTLGLVYRMIKKKLSYD